MCKPALDAADALAADGIAPRSSMRAPQADGREMLDALAQSHKLLVTSRTDPSSTASAPRSPH